jgi:hypothetical protein
MPPIETVHVRAGTAAEWADADATDQAAGPILDLGELGIVTDAPGGPALFTGDGTTRPAAIAYKQRAAKVVQTVTLVAGTKATADVTVKAGTLIIPVLRTLGTVTAAKPIAVTRVADTSFTLTSSDNTDTSTFDVLLIQP